MKKITLLFLFSLTAFLANAQKMTYDTVPYALEHHQKRLAVFKNEPKTTGKIIFLGDSMTEFGDWKKLVNDSAINRGIAGDNTFGVLSRLTDVIAQEPIKLFLKIGINDISQNIPDEVILKNIMTIVQKVQKGSPKTQIFVQSILPTNDAVKAEYPDAFNKNDHVVAVNKQLKSEAKKVGFTFINLYEKFSDKDGKLEVKYADPDGLHLNLMGYQNWVAILKKANYIK